MELESKKIHIIYILAFCPKYEFLRDKNVLTDACHEWTNNQGEKLGIWREDWAHQLGFKILEKQSDIIYEVWRPDQRADKVYEHTFSNGLLHKSFPVIKTPFRSGIRKSLAIYSPMMEEYLLNIISKQKGNQTILLLPASRSVFTVRLKNAFLKKLPIINLHFLNSELLLGSTTLTINPIRFVHELVKAWQMKIHMKSVNNLMVAHKKYIPALEEKYKCKTFFNTFGTDLDFWKPNVDSSSARQKLGLPLDAHIFLFSSRLVPEYQIDQAIKSMATFKNDNWHCIFTSHGTAEYEAYLKSLVNKYHINDRVQFSGYVDVESLKLLYAACDTFFMTSLKNAGPMSTFYAMLMEKQVITTDSGLAAEILKENGCGILVSPTHYAEWEMAIKKVIQGKKPKILNREIMATLLDWDEIVNKWHGVFRKVIEDCNA